MLPTWRGLLGGLCPRAQAQKNISDHTCNQPCAWQCQSAHEFAFSYAAGQLQQRCGRGDGLLNHWKVGQGKKKSPCDDSSSHRQTGQFWAWSARWDMPLMRVTRWQGLRVWFARLVWAHSMRSAKCWQFVYPACELEIIVLTANIERVCMSELELLTCNYVKNIQV